MKIQHQLIINRWEKLSTVKCISVASEIKTFFEEIFENGYTSSFGTGDKVVRFLRGFQFNRAEEIKDEIEFASEKFSLCFCLDLHSVEMSAKIADMFDKYLMSECKPYSEFNKTFFGFWCDILDDEKSKINKKRKRA